MKELFLVNSDKGTRVISENVLAKDLKEMLKDSKVKRNDIEAMSSGALHDNKGTVLEEKQYSEMLYRFANCLKLFSQLTPYNFYKNYPMTEAN